MSRDDLGFAAVCGLYPLLIAAVVFAVILPWTAS
jgi:hypothetical protein